MAQYDDDRIGVSRVRRSDDEDGWMDGWMDGWTDKRKPLEVQGVLCTSAKVNTKKKAASVITTVAASARL